MEVSVPGIVIIGWRARGEALRGRAVRETRWRSERDIDDTDHPWVEAGDVFAAARLQMHATPPLDTMDHAGLDEEPRADRRVPVNLHKTLQREPTIGPRFGRARRRDVVGAETIALPQSYVRRTCFSIGLPREASLIDIEFTRRGRCRLVSGSYVQAFGLLAFWLWNIPGVYRSAI